MNLKNKFNVKRIVSGLLASIMLSQAFIYGDGTCKGLLHTDTIQAMATTQNDENSNQFNDYENRVALSGYVNLEDNRNCEIKVSIFDENWNTLNSIICYPNQRFELVAENITGNTTHIKVESNGYLPRFYKDMGFGSYQLGTENNPEVLLFGDTTYNPDVNNQWSDEVIDTNDLNFVYQQEGKIKGDENYNEYYDFNQDGRLDNEDIEKIAQYDGAIYENDVWYTSSTKEYYYTNSSDISKYDLNDDNIINSSDQQVFCDLYPYTIFKGDEDFAEFAYMDIDENGVIDRNDCEYFETYISRHNGCNPYNDYIYNLTLTGDSYHNGAMYLENTNLDLADYELYVNGNFVFRTANPYNSIWNGNPEVDLNINGGTLFIADQFDFGQANSYDKIIMTNDNGRLYVNGIWNYITLADMEGLWTAGNIYFFGSTWQVNEASGDKAIYSTGTHSICFYYQYGQQVIRWANTQDCIYNEETGEYNTLRRFNFDYKDNNGKCLGVTFPCGYSDDKYYFRASLPEEIVGNTADVTIPYEDWDLFPSSDGLLPDVIKEQLIVNPEAVDNNWLIGFYGGEVVEQFNPSFKPQLAQILGESITGQATNFYQVANVFKDAVVGGYATEIEILKDTAKEFVIKIAGEEIAGSLVTVDGVSKWLFTIGAGNIIKDITQFVPLIAEAKGLIDTSALTAGFVVIAGNVIDGIGNVADKTTEQIKDLITDKIKEEIKKNILDKVFDKVEDALLDIKSDIDENGKIKININPFGKTDGINDFVFSIDINDVKEDIENWDLNYYHIGKTIDDITKLNPYVKMIKEHHIVQKIQGIADENYNKIVVGAINNIIDVAEIVTPNDVDEFIEENIREFWDSEEYITDQALKNLNFPYGQTYYEPITRITNLDYIEPVIKKIALKIKDMLDDNQIVGTNGKESKTFVVSIAVDETTGQVFCGFSNNYYNPTKNNTLVANKMSQRLNIVKTWIETKNKGIMPKKRRNDNEKTIIDRLNNCGEYNAINNALNFNRNISLENLYVYTIKKATGTTFNPCYNCQALYYNYVKFVDFDYDDIYEKINELRTWENSNENPYK